ncbi:kinase-like domain-containing protein [Pisolithus microcarpus]|nr:kinase-like domain-containing protein [Pisolithus microcarpus]
MAHFSRPQSSSAVKISQPTDEDDKAKFSQKKDSPQRQCRNILIYGSCRFQDKGCIYYHPPPSSTSTDVASPEAPAPPSLSAQAVNAPVFVPRTSVDVVPTAPSTQPLPFTPSASPTPYYASQEVEYEGTSLGTYYGTAQSVFVRQPLDYHLYTNPIPETFAPSHFISDNLREELQKRSESSHTIPSMPYHVPEELQGYHSLVPLEPITPERRKFVSWFSTVYRATSINDGAAYVLRRIENFRLTNHAAFGMIESWSRIRHPNIVRVREAFTTRAFNDSSLVVCYDYHPDSQSLMELYFRSMSPSILHGQLSAPLGRIPEATLWTYIIQIANAIRAAHEAGLAVRMIDPAKILLTGKNRLRINACGIVDVLLYDTRQDAGLAQQDDLVMFGRLVIALCCGSITALNALPKALEVMSRVYSAEIKTLALYLISKPAPHKTIAQIMELIGTSRLAREMDEMQIANDRLETELMSELENGRLVRLLCKFGFINERPEFAREPRWSETGDRYIIKLFRDYVFHQVDENGNPVVNLSHVLTCLNKLDCGSDERVMLVSRDEQSCLVVSYKEVKACIESAFSDLSRASR